MYVKQRSIEDTKDLKMESMQSNRLIFYIGAISEAEMEGLIGWLEVGNEEDGIIKDDL